MARPEGFEPPTPRSEVWCSRPLSYGRRSWSGRPDSNRGPLPPHGSALTILRHAPTADIIPYMSGECKMHHEWGSMSPSPVKEKGGQLPKTAETA